METLEDTGVTDLCPIEKGRDMSKAAVDALSFCHLHELSLSLIIVMESSTPVSRADALQSLIRS